MLSKACWNKVVVTLFQILNFMIIFSFHLALYNLLSAETV
jgi:hypothetical protein